MKKLAILITVYNKENYISFIINMLKEQVNDDIEVIIIDDCSTDRSYEVIKECTRDTNFKVYRNEVNLGTGTTKDNALCKVRARYFIYIDGDDLIPEDYVETLLKYVDENKYDIYRFYMRLFPEGEKMDDTFSMCDKIFRTEFVRKIGLNFVRSLRTMEDFYFYKELIKRGATETFIPKVIYIYNHLVENTVTHRKAVSYLTKEWD